MNNDLSKYRLNDDSELDVYRLDIVRFVQFHIICLTDWHREILLTYMKWLFQKVLMCLLR